MDEQLNYAPCGYLTLTDSGRICSINETLLKLLHFSNELVIGRNITSLLTASAKLFSQLYFFPILKVDGKVNELYLSMKGSDAQELPVLISANRRETAEGYRIECIIIPMTKRMEYENELLKAKKQAEEAFREKQVINSELRGALVSLEEKQSELLKLHGENQLYQERMKTELALAKRIQEQILPPAIDTEPIKLMSYFKPSSELSGDLFGYYRLGHDKYGVFILDVMDHGISSALITMSLESVIRTAILQDGNPETVVQSLDRHLHTLFQSLQGLKPYCTISYFVIDTFNKKVEWVNSGHPPAFWMEEGDQLTLLNSTSPPVGLIEGITFEKSTFNYENGGRLFLYTDGVSDVLKGKEIHSIFDRFKEQSVNELCEELKLRLETNASLVQEKDDQCFVVIELMSGILEN